VLNITGRVLPSTIENTHVCAELEDGTIVEEELNVRAVGKSRIKKVFLKNRSAEAYNQCIEPIKEADLIVICPGSLYTSVIVNFLPKGMAELIGKSKAKKIYVANMMTQPGQTDGYSLEDHAREIIRYLGKGVLEYVLVNIDKPSQSIIKAYEKQGSFYMELHKSELESLGVKIIESDILDKGRKKTEHWKKQDYLRHDSAKVAEVIFGLIHSKTKAVILAAGSGTRMRPFSFSESKVMINFFGKPLLAHHVDEFIKNGVDDFVIVCNKHNLEKIREYFEKHYKNCSFSFCLQENQLGSANALLAAKEKLMGSYFILKYGDSISEEDQIKGVLEEFNKDRTVDTVITLRHVKNPAEYGIARFSGKNLVEIVEKPENAPSDLANVGLCIMKASKFFKALDKIGFETVIAPPDYVLREKGKASYWVTTGQRVDVGRAWNILEANELFVKKSGGGKVESLNIAETAKIGKNAYIGPRAVIGENAVIRGFSSVDGFVGDNSIIEDSVIMPGTRIGKNCKIMSSVIGTDNLIEDNFITETKSQADIQVYIKDRYVNSAKQKLGLFTGENVRIMANLKSMPGRIVFPNKVVNYDIEHDMLIRAVLFDADNTLYKTKQAAKKADMGAMRFFAKQCRMKPEEIYKDWKKIISMLINEKDPKKRHRKHSYRILAQNLDLKDVDKAFEIFLKKLVDSIEEMPNLKGVMNYLKKYNLAVFTEDTKDLTNPKLDKFGLRDVFDLIITSDDIGEMKPSEEYFSKVFKKFKISPNECLVIGDNYAKDLEIPQKMGATVVNFGSRNKQADYSITGFKELEIILRRL